MVRMPHWPIPYTNLDMGISLERMRELLGKVGSPQYRLPPVIHVTGTNGKGSTIAFLEYMFRDAGYKVHKYTSPHIEHYNERIVLGGEVVDDNTLARYIEQVRTAVGDEPSTFFEGTTAAAFLMFANHPADVFLCEVGMGGRLDATNVVVDPICTVITPISEDHSDILGDISNITFEKAGIMKHGSPCVVSWQFSGVSDALVEIAKDRDIEAYVQGRDWGFEVHENYFTVTDKNGVETYPMPVLEGLHQIINAATAIQVINTLNYPENPKYDITKENVQAGLLNAKWRARMEKMHSHPGGWEIWVDGAHNPHAAEMIAAHVANNWRDTPTYLIQGRTADRDIKSFILPFKDIVQAVACVKVHGEPKSESPEKLHKITSEAGMQSRAFEGVQEAIDWIIKHHPPGKILVCGSLYLYADCKLCKINPP